MKKTFLILLSIFALIIAITGLFLSFQNENPSIVIETEVGDIVVELYLDKAPITATNFLKYVDENRLEEATFYRTVRVDNQPNSKVKIDVIQGGLYEDNHPMMLDPIVHENTEVTGIKHLDGVISMARYGPGTATSEFFICVGDQPKLDFGGNRNSDGAGYATFGKVTRGMDVVHLIHQAHAEGQYHNPRIKILSIKRK
ncbi:MAG: peptidylprolyl isomerase [Bacteroidales bacterium]|jgi:peptidyl-prolyl cis-trans isomerase A (cyclophilin A)|nr:peptidylprolyl isomerase [Bacteroidales bacterium]